MSALGCSGRPPGRYAVLAGDRWSVVPAAGRNRSGWTGDRLVHGGGTGVPEGAHSGGALHNLSAPGRRDPLQNFHLSHAEGDVRRGVSGQRPPVLRWVLAVRPPRLGGPRGSSSPACGVPALKPYGRDRLCGVLPPAAADHRAGAQRGDGPRPDPGGGPLLCPHGADLPPRRWGAAFRPPRLQPTETPADFPLFVLWREPNLARPTQDRSCARALLLESTWLRTEQAVPVCPERLTEEPWQEIPVGALLVVEPDLSRRSRALNARDTCQTEGQGGAAP